MRAPQEPVMKLSAALAMLSGTAAAHAQPRHLFLDRTAGAQAVYAVEDLDASNTITEPGELFTYFNNSSGISPAMATLTAIAVRSSDGTVAVGDSAATVRGVFFLRDDNRNNS